jgi:hypothetical protein
VMRPHVRCSSLSISQPSLATRTGGYKGDAPPRLHPGFCRVRVSPTCGSVRCAFFDRNLHSRMPLSFTLLLRLKRCHACDQWHSSRAPTPLTGWHCKLRPATEGTGSRGTRHRACDADHELCHHTDDVTQHCRHRIVRQRETAGVACRGTTARRIRPCRGSGARFRTEICTRECHWIPRMFA